MSVKPVRETPQDEISLNDLENYPRLSNEQDELPDDLAFQSIINELGLSDESGSVNVYKLQGGNYHDQIFLFDCMPAEFKLSMLQNPDYHSDGFHKFKVILRNSRNIVKAKQIAVMPNAKLFEKVADTPHNNSNDLILAIKSINDSNQALITALIASQHTQSVVVPQKSTMDFLQEMQLMREVMGINQAPVAPAAQQSPLEVLELAKELALAMNPEANTGIMNTMGRMLEKYGEPIMNAIASAPKPQMPALKTNPIPINPHGITPNPLPPSLVTAEPKDDMQIMLKMYLSQLVNQAKRGADVNLYADLIIDQLGDEIYPLLETPDWFEKLTLLNGDVAPLKAWFERLRSAILFEPQNEEELTTLELDDINEVKSTLPHLNDELENANKFNP